MVDFRVPLVLGMAWLLACGGAAWAQTKQPPQAAAERLREMGERQGHSRAAEKALRNLGYEVPWADEENGRALAERVRVSRVPDGDFLVKQLESVLGRRLPREQKDAAIQEFRQFQAELQRGRSQFAANVAASTLVPLDQVEEAARSNRLGAALADSAFLDQLGGAAGRTLNARELREIQSADETRLAEIERLDQAAAFRLAKAVGFTAEGER